MPDKNDHERCPIIATLASGDGDRMTTTEQRAGIMLTGILVGRAMNLMQSEGLDSEPFIAHLLSHSPLPPEVLAEVIGHDTIGLLEEWERWSHAMGRKN